MNRFKLNLKGATLVEVMVVLAITAIVTMGIVQMFTMLKTTEVQARVSTSMQMLKLDLQKVLTDTKSWQNTVQFTGNAEMACLRASPMTDCTPISTDVNGTDNTIEGYTLILKDSNNNTYYDSSVATKGFTSSGIPCNTFSVSGDSKCPLRYNLTWKPKCASSTSCTNPSIVVLGKVSYSPSPGSALANVSFNANNYNIALNQGTNNKYQPFTVYYELSGTNYYEGACSTSGWTDRSMNGKNDPASILGSIASTGVTSVTFPTGTFQCEVSVPAFQVNNFKVRLYDSTNSLTLGNVGSGYAGLDSLSRGTASALFTLTAPAALKIQQQCEVSLNTSTNYDLGFAAPAYTTPTLMSYLKCVKSD